MNERQMQHGINWDAENLSGWSITEKFDGCRAFWDGFNLWSRSGKSIDIPQAWHNQLPKAFRMDCEIYFGVDGVYKCGSAVRYGRFHDGMQLIVFDAPDAGGEYSDRIAAAQEKVNDISFIRVVKVSVAASTAGALSEMDRVQARGGEGLVVRHPNHSYVAGRTGSVLKLKRR